MSESNEIPDPMPATRKRTSATAKKTTVAKKAVAKKGVQTLEVKAPTPLLTLDDYKKDIIIRWQIHSYEVDLLGKDLQFAYNAVSKQFVTVVEFIKTRYQAEFSK